MEHVLASILRQLIRTGNLRVRTVGNSSITTGDGTGQPCAIFFTTNMALFEALLDPELKFGEAYMDGTLIIEQGSLIDVLSLLASQTHKTPWLSRVRIRRVARYILRRLQFNSPPRSRRNVAHHYDLDDHLYDLFLDEDRQYSCAYFEGRSQSLEAAQLAKKRHLAAKLLTEPGQRLLDIGCGWGGLAIYLAEICGLRVTGITLSERQLAIARRRAGRARCLEFKLEDYRDTSSRYDRIVSVGMFEHVGVGFYEIFFRKCAQLLHDDGVIVLSSIGRSEGPNSTNPWIAKYIFPGGYIPALSEVLRAVERAGLLVTDIEILRLQYAETLKAWRERFMARRQTVEDLYDARFVRMWEFYLAASEVAFRDHAMMVFQLQLTKRQDVVPMTRDYVAKESARLNRLERARRPSLSLASE